MHGLTLDLALTQSQISAAARLVRRPHLSHGRNLATKSASLQNADRAEDSGGDLPPHLTGRASRGMDRVTAAAKGQSPDVPSLGSMDLPPGFGPPRHAAGPPAKPATALAGKMLRA